MARQILMAIALLAASLGTAAAAPGVAPATECLNPGPRPLLPDGSFATRDQIDGARDSVYRFNTALRDYRACLQQKLDTAPAAVGPATRQEWLTAVLASVTTERALDMDMSNQVAKFQTRRP
jgi:hypothetical protein